MIALERAGIRRYLALSRTTHAVLDLAAPGFCALLWLGDFPDLPTIALSLITAFAAYAAIYALNDLVGVRDDREKFDGSDINPGYSMDAAAERHPVAQGMLSVRSGVAWMTAWFAVALAGSYLLNPVIVFVLLAAAVLEVIYCRLLKVTHLRTLIGGIVKAGGPTAAILVVDPSPAIGPALLLFAWMFCWEIGGQNVPSDWNDTGEDRRVGARTIPLRYGFRKAGWVILTAISISMLLSSLLPLISPARLGPAYIALMLGLGYVLLMRPALRLVSEKQGRLAAQLFESASYYPIASLGLMAAFLAADVLLSS